MYSNIVTDGENDLQQGSLNYYGIRGIEKEGRAFGIHRLKGN